jgi:hypothetical protein
MGKWGKLYSNVWIKIDDDDFDKLKQIQMDYQLDSVEEVLELLVNSHSINRLCEQADEYANEIDSRLRFTVTPANN